MFLGLDLGTTNIKAVVVDRGGRVVARGSAPVGRRDTPDGGVEQDVEQIWQATADAVREAAGGPVAGAIEAIGLSSQGGAMQLLDDAGEALGPVISWLDGRGRPFDQALMRELGEEFFAGHVGCRSCLISPGQILRLRQQEPDRLRRAAGVGFVGDVIAARLCGRRAHDATSLSIAFLFNPFLNRADPDLLLRLELREEQLPVLVPADCSAGPLRVEAARRLGLRPGIPVSPACHDQYAASLGVGAVREGDVSLGTGTAWAMLANAGHLGVPVTSMAIVCPHPVNGLHGQLLSMVNGGSTIQWAGQLTGRQLACEAIDAAVESVPAGADGLMMWPRLADSTETSTGRGGRIAGIRLAHGPNHLLRAAIEGLACELARHFRMLAAGGQEPRRLLLSGGAASSRVTPQILADVTGQPVAAVAEPAVSAWGAAVIARALTEPHGSLARLAQALAPPSQSFLPGENAGIYRELLARYLEE